MTAQLEKDCDENWVAAGPFPGLYHDEMYDLEIVDEANVNTYFSFVELEEFVISRECGETECKYRQLGLLDDGLNEQVEREKLCGVRKPDGYLLHAYLSGPDGPCCECAFVEIGGSDHYVQVKGCVFSCACEDGRQICHADV